MIGIFPIAFAFYKNKVFQNIEKLIFYYIDFSHFPCRGHPPVFQSIILFFDLLNFSYFLVYNIRIFNMQDLTFNCCLLYYMHTKVVIFFSPCNAYKTKSFARNFSSVPIKFKVDRSVQKVMASVFWYCFLGRRERLNLLIPKIGKKIFDWIGGFQRT